LADAVDSKSTGSNTLWVRNPPRAFFSEKEKIAVQNNLEYCGLFWLFLVRFWS